jgi:hypothetical protein
LLHLNICPSCARVAKPNYLFCAMCGSELRPSRSNYSSPRGRLSFSGGDGTRSSVSVTRAGMSRHSTTRRGGGSSTTLVDFAAGYAGESSIPAIAPLTGGTGRLFIDPNSAAKFRHSPTPQIRPSSRRRWAAILCGVVLVCLIAAAIGHNHVRTPIPAVLPR